MATPSSNKVPESVADKVEQHGRQVPSDKIGQHCGTAYSERTEAAESERTWNQLLELLLQLLNVLLDILQLLNGTKLRNQKSAPAARSRKVALTSSSSEA